MATIKRFEDIGAWQKARVLARRVYQLTRDGPAARDFGYRDQLRRAALSVLLNIAEGFERESGDKDPRHFFFMAKGSAGEVRAALYVGLDCGYFSPGEFEELYPISAETIRMLSRLITYLDSSSRRPHT